MAIDFTSDLDFVLKDTGVVVTLGATSTFGQVDVADEALLAEQGVYGARRAVVVKTGTLTGVAQDASVTVDGKVYTIVAHQRLDEGGLTRIFLAG